MNLRKFIGWCVAILFIVTGRRYRCVRQYDKKGNILSFYTHNPKPEVLEEVLKWLSRKGFAFISTDELLAIKDGQMPWRRRCAWLTFDDGWAGFEEKLLPILEKYHCPATIFVPPKEIERGQVWTNSIMSAVEDITSYYALPAEERYEKVDKVLKKVGNPRHLASKEELIRLSQHPLITLENHTDTHISCASRPVEEVIAEVRNVQDILTEWTGRIPRLICYPFGHYTIEIDTAMKKMNLTPVHSNPGIMSLETIGLHRNMFHERMTTSENVGRVLGAWVEVKQHDL